MIELLDSIFNESFHYNTAQLWQKEATGKSPKSEKVTFLDWT